MTETVIIRKLAENETIVARGLMNFVETGRALQQIRDERQYLEAGHKSFEAYLKERWSMSRVHAHRFIEASGTVENLLPIGNTSKPPKTESVARAVAAETKEPEKQREIWQEATADNPEPTAADVKKAAAKVAAKAEPKPQPEPDPATIDALDGPIDPSLETEWECLPEFRKLIAQLGSVGNGVKDLLGHPGGCRLPQSQINDLLKELKRAIKFSKPHTECFKCQRKIRDACPLCKGAGWITEAEDDKNRTEGGDRWLKSR